MSVFALTISTVAWPAVVVQESSMANQQTNAIREGDESPATGQQPNLIGEGSFGSGRIGGRPPKPWQCSKGADRISVTVETPPNRPEAERWVRLLDDSDKENASIRQSFGPLTSGQFQARLISARNGGRLFFNLGSGAASKPEERAVQLSIDSDGLLGVRDARQSKTSMPIRAGEVYLVRCDFEPVREGQALRIHADLVEESTQRQSRVETEVETRLAITTVRVTSTRPDTGVDYYVTDLSLTGR